MVRPRWRATALALATAVLLGISAPDANALALGRVTVQSALGEPLRAEIEIPEIDADEIASLRSNVAAPDAFKAAGFDYNPALTGIRITLEKRADGRYFLRLTSQRPINDPFIDLILESTWSSGRIVRDYTMLFDPPSLRQGQPLAAEVTPSAPPTARAAPATGATTPAQRSAAAESPRAPAAEGGKQVTVKAGDTAGKIATANKPAQVSLDQMLVALLRGNRDAFIGGNINRLRSGAVLAMPSAQEAALVPPDEARQTLVAQSRDFNEFRRRLADGVPATKVSPADRQASGKITAQVEEKRPAASAPDKLTLSKGSAQAKNGAEEKIARERAAKDTASRVAELNKNIADLGKLGKGSAAPAAAASATKGGVPVPVGAPMAVAAASAAKGPAATTPAAPVAAAASAPAPAKAASAAPAPVAAAAAVPAAVAASAAPAASAAAPAVAAASAPASAAVAAASAAAPAASAASAAAPSEPAVVAKPASAAKPVAKRAPPPPPPEPSLIDDLLENWLVPVGAVGGILALLGAGFGVYRVRQRKKNVAVDSSFLESRLQPDSFFGASGGQRIDTNEGGVSGSSLVYSPSQLDAAGDVDPVAEADVYLAYGRDLQAEEILKEAMRTQPQRVAIHAKLLEIYAKRRDSRAFELVATEAYGLTHGAGSEWERICELGQEVDPTNSLYRPGGQPGAAEAAPVAAAAMAAAVQTQALAPAPVAEAPVEAVADIDLDLDFSLGDEPPPAPVAAERTQPMPAAVEPMPSLDMDFGATQKTAAPSSGTQQAVRLEAPDLGFDGNSLNFDLEAPQVPAIAAAPAAAASTPASDGGMLEFDLGGLSLDIGAAAKPAATEGLDTADAPISTAGAPLSTGGFEDTGGDPLATKLALAREFHSIGDPDGARSLAQEVLAEASGALKTEAQKFLAEIG